MEKKKREEVKQNFERKKISCKVCHIFMFLFFFYICETVNNRTFP